MSKSKITGFISLFIIFIIGILPIPSFSKVILTVLIFAAVFYLNRAFFWFLYGNKIIMSKKQEKLPKAWALYRKSFNAKLAYKYRINMGNILVQRGDPKFSLEVLNSIIDECNDPALITKAKIQKSMALERTGEIKQAINELEEVREQGNRERGLYINLVCYLLYEDEQLRAKEVIEESKDLEDLSIGMLDNRGWLLILEEKWEEAAILYAEIIERAPKFPDPYIHSAQIKLHYGNVGSAIELFEKSLDTKWSQVVFFNKDIINSIIENLKKEDNSVFIASMLSSVAKVAKGDKPDEISKEDASKIIEAGFEKEPENITIIDEEFDDNIIEETSSDIDLEESDELPNTSLTDEDEEWEKNHKD